MKKVFYFYIIFCRGNMLKCLDGVVEGGGVVEELFLKMIYFLVFIDYCFEDFEYNIFFLFLCYLVNM